MSAPIGNRNAAGNAGGGAPVGNDNVRKSRWFREALRESLAEFSGGDCLPGEATKRLCYRLIEMGLYADASQALGAIREIFDRIDGKPVQAVEFEGRVRDVSDKPLTNDEWDRQFGGG